MTPLSTTIFVIFPSGSTTKERNTLPWSSISIEVSGYCTFALIHFCNSAAPPGKPASTSGKSIISASVIGASTIAGGFGGGGVTAATISSGLFSSTILVSVGGGVACTSGGSSCSGVSGSSSITSMSLFTALSAF